MNGNDKNIFGILAEFDDPGSLLHAAEKTKDAGYRNFDCYSPFPVHGMDEAMGLKRSPLGYIIAFISFFVVLGGLGLQWYANAVDYPIVISGKPLVSYQAYAPVGFGLTVAVAAIFTFIIMLALNRLPQPHHPLFSSERFEKVTDDGFFLGIESKDKQFDIKKTETFLDSIGGKNIEILKD
ncbi:DUF3341 domain-containing protein [candidate division KSB1 bacterium]